MNSSPPRLRNSAGGDGRCSPPARLSAILGRPESFPELLGEPKDAMAALRRADAAAVAAAGGDLQAANLLLAEGLQIAEEQELDGQRAIILTTRAELLLKMRSPLEAQTLLRTASALFEQQGMRSQLGRARRNRASANCPSRARREDHAAHRTRTRSGRTALPGPEEP